MLSQLTRLFTREQEFPAHEVYITLIAQSRNAFFYGPCAVPDTLDGRHEMIVVHLFLLLHRLREEKDPAIARFGQRLIEVHFDNMDQSLRELGVGDMGVGKRVKAMATAFYGRIKAYEEAANNPSTWQETLTRNVYGTTTPEAEKVKLLANYIEKNIPHLMLYPATDIVRNKFGYHRCYE